MAQTTVFAYHAPPSSKCSCPSRSRIGSSRRSLSRGSSLHKTRHTLFLGCLPYACPEPVLANDPVDTKMAQTGVFRTIHADDVDKHLWHQDHHAAAAAAAAAVWSAAGTHTHTHTHYTALTLAHTHCERHSAEQPDIGNPGRPCPQDLQLPERIERLGLERDAELRRESLPQHAKGEHQLEDVEAPAENAPFFAFSAFPMFVPSLSW